MALPPILATSHPRISACPRCKRTFTAGSARESATALSETLNSSTSRSITTVRYKSGRLSTAYSSNWASSLVEALCSGLGEGSIIFIDVSPSLHARRCALTKRRMARAQRTVQVLISSNIGVLKDIFSFVAIAQNRTRNHRNLREFYFFDTNCEKFALLSPLSLLSPTNQPTY